MTECTSNVCCILKNNTESVTLLWDKQYQRIVHSVIVGNNRCHSNKAVSSSEVLRILRMLENALLPFTMVVHENGFKALFSSFWKRWIHFSKKNHKVYFLKCLGMAVILMDFAQKSQIILTGRRCNCVTKSINITAFLYIFFKNQNVVWIS